MGRRKIEMKMVKDSSSRQVTFSKRRMGLFKKANELVTLCACHIALIIISPGGKPYGFGHPDMEFIVERFLSQGMKQEETKVKGFVDPQQKDRIEKLNTELNDLLKQLQEEKKRGKFLDEMIRKEKGAWELEPIDEMSMSELLEMKEELEALRFNVKARATEIEASSSLLLLSEKLAEDASKEDTGEK